MCSRAGPPILFSAERLNHRNKTAVDFVVHMDNSIRHNARRSVWNWNITELNEPLTPYSPDISPDDFWLFGFRKEKLTEWALSTLKEILEVIPAIWNDVTFEELQGTFCE
jgi:hypothetical protein